MAVNGTLEERFRPTAVRHAPSSNLQPVGLSRLLGKEIEVASNAKSIIRIVGFHFIEQKRAFSLEFLLCCRADSPTPAAITEIEPSGSCFV